METVFLETIDGVSIEADLVRTDNFPVRATVIIGHPHPLYGGNRFHPVVQALHAAASHLGCHSISVDFRGVGNSGGIHDDGDAERLDLAAACELVDMIEPDCPIVMAGYSFGATVALNVGNPWIAAWLAFAPPVALMKSTPIAANNPRTKILVAAEDDQFTSLDDMRRAVADWTNTHIIEVSGADHFFTHVALDDLCSSALEHALAQL